MKVLLCFETHLLAEGIKRVMLQLTAEAHFDLLSPEDRAIERILDADFDLLLLDADSKQADASDILQKVKTRSPYLKVMFVYDRLGSDVLKAFRNGLDGCFSKKESTEDVKMAISAVLDGKVHVPQAIIMNIICEGFVFTDFDSRLNQLTKREVSVLHHISSASSMKEAAQLMKLAPSTLSAHKQHIMKKLKIGTGQEFNNFLRAFEQWQKSPTMWSEEKK